MVDKASLVNEIKARLPISSVVKTAVELKGTGPNFIGLCPFHQEKTPSFHVRDQAARFKCFGCGASGDVIEFTMRVRNLQFKEAVLHLAEAAGLVSEPQEKTPEKKVRADLLAAQTIAQEFFTAELNNEATGVKALSYLMEKRGLSKKMIEQAGIGFGGLSRDRFFNHLHKRGVSEKFALEAGLVKQGKFSLSPQFLSRITFPIRTFEGRIVAFGGRSFLEQDESPKYVNTHTYRYYEKRRSFYGLFESKRAILKGMTPFLVEGYFDAMAFWAMGMPAVALCGTALSEEHAASLKKISQRLTVCFDADEAGMLALKKSLIELNRYEIAANLIILARKDPGAYLEERRIAELKEIAANPIDSLCYVIDRSSSSMSGVVLRMQQIDSLLPILASIKRPLARRQYVVYLANRLHEDPSLLWAEIEGRLKNQKRTKTTRDQNSVKAPMILLNATERLLVRIIILHKSLFAAMDEVFPHVSPEAKALIEVLAMRVSSETHDDDIKIVQTVVQSYNKDFWPEVAHLLHENIVLSLEEAQTSLLALKAKFERQLMKESLRKKRLLLQGFEKKKDFSAVLQTLKEQSELLNAQKPRVLERSKSLGETKSAPASFPQEQGPTHKNKKITYLDEETAIFDSSEDWL